MEKVDLLTEALELVNNDFTFTKVIDERTCLININNYSIKHMCRRNEYFNITIQFNEKEIYAKMFDLVDEKQKADLNYFIENLDTMKFSMNGKLISQNEKEKELSFFKTLKEVFNL
jgi:hypothetical protein